MNYMLVRKRREKGGIMLAEINEIFLIIEQFCVDNWIVILSCASGLALILAIICLVKLSAKKNYGNWNDMEEMKLSFNIEKAEVNVASLNKEFEDKLTRDDAGQRVQEETKSPVADDSAAPVVIEKLIPIEPGRIESEEFCRSKSGRVYSEDEIKNRIRD